MPARPALVLALHGCGQSAADYVRGSGWSTLAEQLGFVVVFAEQQASNNANTCFSWFQPADVTRNRGEALSIRQMVEHAVVTHGVDQSRVFVTGLSAGGAMAAAMLATYPDVFAAGAIIAGLPYGCAESVQDAFAAMFTEQVPSPRVLGDRVRAASRHGGPWPKLSVWHGTADALVKPSNMEHIVRQWVSVHGLSARHSREDVIGGHTRRVWQNSSRAAVIEAYSINGMGHGVPLAWRAETESVGTAGPYFLEAGISSTHCIARFFGLGEAAAASRDTAARRATDLVRPQTDLPAIADAACAGAGAKGADAAPSEPWASKSGRAAYDPNLVIAAAFKSAGLPVPAVRGGHSKPLAAVDPGAIIDAALKAAGLKP